MICYEGTQFYKENAKFEDFAHVLERVLVAGTIEPIVLVRDDGTRLFVVVSENLVMLSLVRSRSDFKTSYAQSYLEGPCEFRSFGGTVSGDWKNFVDPQWAMEAVRAFFDKCRMSEYVDFSYGVPDTNFLEFPEPVGVKKPMRRRTVRKRVDIPAELAADLREVCLFIEENENDREIELDYDDAIQIGSLCGGEIHLRAGVFRFSYHLPSGEIWDFRLDRGQMESIADRALKAFDVTAYEPV